MIINITGANTQVFADTTAMPGLTLIDYTVPYLSIAPSVNSISPKSTLIEAVRESPVSPPRYGQTLAN